jgi:hypothetical protein
MSIRRAPRSVEPAQHRVSNANKDALEDLDAVAYLENIEHITDSKSHPQPPLPRTDNYPGAGTSLIEYIAEPW